MSSDEKSKGNKPKITPPPEDTPSVPDSATLKNPDFTGPSAENRVLHLSLRSFKYGTDDKAHAASLVATGSLLVVIIGITICGAFASETAQPLISDVIKYLFNALMLSLGVALGTSTGGK